MSASPTSESDALSAYIGATGVRTAAFGLAEASLAWRGKFDAARTVLGCVLVCGFGDNVSVFTGGSGQAWIVHAAGEALFVALWLWLRNV